MQPTMTVHSENHCHICYTNLNFFKCQYVKFEVLALVVAGDGSDNNEEHEQSMELGESATIKVRVQKNELTRNKFS